DVVVQHRRGLVRPAVAHRGGAVAGVHRDGLARQRVNVGVRRGEGVVVASRARGLDEVAVVADAGGPHQVVVGALHLAPEAVGLVVAVPGGVVDGDHGGRHVGLVRAGDVGGQLDEIIHGG